MNQRVPWKTPQQAETKKKVHPLLAGIFRSSVASPKTDTKGTSNSAASHLDECRPISGAYVFFVCLSVLVAGAGMLYHLHVRFEGVRLGYATSEQRKIQTKLMLKRRELRLELASMKEPGRIEDEAREKLGMETPKSEEFIHISKKKKVVSVSGGAL